MRRFLLLVGVAAAVPLVVLVALLMREPDLSQSVLESDLIRDCPFRLTVNGQEQAVGENGLGPWKIFVSDTYGTAPHVNVDQSRERPAGVQSESCALEIVRLPGKGKETANLDGVDWRIGHIKTAPKSVAGKIATISMTLKADMPVRFGHAAVYSYDGKNVIYNMVEKLGTSWETFTWQHEVPADAAAFETWLRLTIHAPISDEATVYLSDVRVDVADGSTEAATGQ